jgi:hypothetical protein
MAERSRKPYIRPVLRDCGRITERALESIRCSQEASEAEPAAAERVMRSRSRYECEDR